MLHGRWCPQTSAGVWHRARSQQRPEDHDGGALASEAGDMWENVQVFFFLHVFSIPPTSEESALDGAEQVAPPGVVHIDAAAPWRSEARHADSVIIVLLVPAPTPNCLFYSVSCRFSQ